MIGHVTLDGGPLTIDDVVAVAEGSARVEVGADLAGRMRPARELVERVISEDRTVYGITTGFGALASTHIDPADVVDLQYSLLRSHAAGVGTPLPDALVRAMLLLRARTLGQGFSGVRVEVVDKLVDLLNRGLLPVVPGQGSVGASGDLAPFAHLALPLIGEGSLRDNGADPEPASTVLARHGVEPLRLGPKEGLGMVTGTEGMRAMGCLSVARGRRLARAAGIACGLSVEALLGSARPFQSRIHELRPHPGQVAAAATIRAMLEGSEIGASHSEDFIHAVQDAYSLRCAPQVHGAVHDAIEHAADIFGRELGAVVDNPVVFADAGDVVSAGNFHGQPLAFALDYMAIAVTELGSISERRTDRILDPDRSSGLPPFLAAIPGLHSGYMLAQYTAAALVAENRVLSHPASVESIPTSGSQEDHVSMGWGAGRKLGEVIDNTERVLGVELVCAAQGIEYRRPLLPSPRTAAAVELIRTVVAPLERDRPVGEDIEAVARLLAAGAFDSILEDL